MKSDVFESFLAGVNPEVYVVCGTGFKDIALQYPSYRTLNFDHVFPSRDDIQAPKVPGHGSELRLCQIGSRWVCFQTGRKHMYQGYSAYEVAEPVFAAAQAGITHFILTNAAGGLHEGIRPGDVVVLNDFINLTFENCLIGTEHAVRFIDMKNAFSDLWSTAVIQNLGLKQGIYCGLKGPTFETAAETRFLRNAGADVVGMSTVQEIIAARAMGAQVLGLSFVSNLCGDLNTLGSSHQEVLDSGQIHSDLLSKILKLAIELCPT